MLNRVVIVFLLLHLLPSCAGVGEYVETFPKLKMDSINLKQASSEEFSAVVGVYTTIEEKYFGARNIGVFITSVDNQNITTWNGAVFPSGKHKIKVRFTTAPFSSEDIELEANFPARSRCIVMSSTDQQSKHYALFWIEDINSGKVIAGIAPKKASPNINAEKFKKLIDHYKVQLNGLKI